MKLCIPIAGACLALAACASHSQAVPSAAQNGSLSMTLKIPAAPSQSAIRPQYTSPGTKAVVIRTGLTTISANVTPGSPNCAPSGSATLCTFNNIGAPSPSALISVTAYDQTLSSSGAAQGNVLSSGSVSVTISPGQVNNVNLTMGGAAARAVITSLNTQPLNGNVSDLNFHVNILDADGFTIVAPGVYSSPFGGGTPEPVTFNIRETPISDSLLFTVNGVNQVFADEAQLNGPADTYSLQYSGRGVISATLNVETLNNSKPLASATISPQAAYVPVAGTPPLEASAVVEGYDAATTWFTEPSRAKLAFVRFGTLREIAIPSGNTPTLLVPAPMPGRQQFAYATAQGTIGFASDDGSISEYTPLTHSTIGGIHFNSGILTAYFTETTAGKIGKLGVGGFLSEISLPAGEHPTAMDPISGDFADPATNSIGFIDPSDKVTERALPSANSQPSGLAQGPQGSLWISEGAAKRVAELSPDGTIVEFPTQDILTSISVVAAEPFVAATDASGNIELINLDGSETTYSPGTQGPATNIGEAHNDDLLYVCASCASGIQDFLY